MSKKWKALHKREFEEKIDSEYREPKKQLQVREEPMAINHSLAKCPSSRLTKYFSGR